MHENFSKASIACFKVSDVHQVMKNCHINDPFKYAKTDFCDLEIEQPINEIKAGHPLNLKVEFKARYFLNCGNNHCMLIITTYFCKQGGLKAETQLLIFKTGPLELKIFN